MPQTFSYIYGPVYSWRLGMSLGVDPLSAKQKVCTFNCTYCQLGDEAPVATQRRIFVPTSDIIAELSAVSMSVIDHITFSGCGEPTLAANLGEMIAAVKEKYPTTKVAVITNGSLLPYADVRRELAAADSVLVKVDAIAQEDFVCVNRPEKSSAECARFLDGILAFRREYRGRFVLQVMFVARNQAAAPAIADFARRVKPDEVQVNTPLRSCAEKPLDEKTISSLCVYFKGLPVVSVYDAEKKKYQPFDDEKTKKRHGAFRDLADG